MALLSGFEILFAVAIVGILLLVGVRSRRTGFNFMPYVIVGALLFVVLALSRTVFSLVKLVLTLGVIVLVLGGLFICRLVKNRVS